MKAILLIVVIAICGCPQPPHKPAGYKTCSADWECPKPQFCGFVGVDTYAVCRN